MDADIKKKHLLKTQSSKVLPFKPGAGPYIAMHATLTARDFFLANFNPSSQFTSIFFQKLSQVFPVLAVANTGSCVDPQSNLGHPARGYRELMQVPVLSARGV